MGKSSGFYRLLGNSTSSCRAERVGWRFVFAGINALPLCLGIMLGFKGTRDAMEFVACLPSLVQEALVVEACLDLGPPMLRYLEPDVMKARCSAAAGLSQHL